MSGWTPSEIFLRPTVARVQDHLDGGRDNYTVDRELTRELLAVAPWLPASVRINRAHGPRILDCFTQQLGIDQVIDLGCGLPHDDHLSLPDAVRHIVYVDSDPMVEAHARMSLAERTGTASLLADLADMPALLAAAPIERLDRGRPIGVLLHDVLPWIGADTARTVLTALHDWLPPGSVLSLTHATGDFARQGQLVRLSGVYEKAGIAFRPRTSEGIKSLLGSWTLLDGCGLVTTATWRLPSTTTVRPPGPHTLFDHSHAYAALATTGDQTT
ncbi:SAM-dependent methyltransferase [Streptomyces sp. Wb2n-11]|uniref:SAM-dependent methyltransferase n=1 Tax=Streptomyces sp. Wb2n-11 TaxID=1030533 RepID=UPI000A9CE91C|nr:SAM-dependent methyltransferase [Streptomyces sp. Wb2n-11]